MRTYTLAALGCLLGLSVGTAHAQRGRDVTGTQFGVKGGLTLAVLDGQINTNSEYKPDFHLGGFLRRRPTPSFALQPELVYSRQGAKNSFPVGPVTLETKTTLSYLNVPVLAKVYLGKVFHLQVGPQFGLLLGGREKGQVGYTQSSNGNSFIEDEKDVKDEFKSDIAICGGIGIDLPSGLTVGARLNYGFTNIENNELRQRARDAFGFGGMHNLSLIHI